MHYGKDDFSSNGGDTISAPQEIRQRNGADKEYIRQVLLLYQCRSSPRSVAEYETNPCTSDRKCWGGAVGCNGGGNACQGDLVCSVVLITSASNLEEVAAVEQEAISKTFAVSKIQTCVLLCAKATQTTETRFGFIPAMELLRRCGGTMLRQATFVVPSIERSVSLGVQVRR